MKNIKITWPLVGLTLIISNGLFAIIMAWSLPHLSALAAGLAMFDARPTGYDFVTAQFIINTLGQDGRQFYLSTQLKLDMAYPALFAISFALLIVKFSHVLNLQAKWRYNLLIAPLLTGLFDYVENYFISQMLIQADQLTAITVQNASFLTICKSTASSLTQVISLVLLILVIIQKYRNPPHAKL